MKSLNVPGRWEKFLWPAVAFALLLAAWHFAVIWTGTKVLPSPLEVKKGLAELLQEHVLWNDIQDSLRRVAIGFGAAALVGSCAREPVELDVVDHSFVAGCDRDPASLW